VSVCSGKRCPLVLTTGHRLSVLGAVGPCEDRLRFQPWSDLSSPSTSVSGKKSVSSSPFTSTRPPQSNLRAPPRNGSTAAHSSSEITRTGQRIHDSASAIHGTGRVTTASPHLSPARKHGEMRMRARVYPGCALALVLFRSKNTLVHPIVMDNARLSGQNRLV
jgi:hypothetical protein